jgi:hypothetical protein
VYQILARIAESDSPVKPAFSAMAGTDSTGKPAAIKSGLMPVQARIRPAMFMMIGKIGQVSQITTAVGAYNNLTCRAALAGKVGATMPRTAPKKLAMTLAMQEIFKEIQTLP